ncbi:MAG: cation diffusion facilitator family transporter [Halioglobus sp.]|nr:cation diffusion facilitator family transporter [Halioglobus sp.]
MTKTSPEAAAVSPEESARLMRLATYASITVAIILVLAKTVAWAITDSVSILATLIDSTLDSLASLINLFAVRQAVMPADREHRFGHGKAEALAGLGQSAFIAGSAGFLLLESGRRLMSPVPLESYGPGLVVMGFSIVLTLALITFQRHVVRKTNSTAIKADALHYRTDFMVNGSVILALVLAIEGWHGFDALFAIGIAIYILYSSWEIVRQSLDDLMDRELPEEEREAIKRIAMSHAEVRGLHDLRSRRSGIATFLQLHIEVADNLSLLHAHRISDEVERELQQAYPAAEIIIHVDPESIVPLEPVPEFLQNP